MSYKASLIISVYNDTDSLKAVLDSLRYQTEKSFELIISEDGESEGMRDFVASYPFQNDYQHLTQEDKGWRKNQALNRAIKAARTEWLIFIDGDCVLHPRFIEYHLKRSGDKFILAGKRIKLNAVLSEMLIKDSSFIMKMQKKLLNQFFSARKNGLCFYEEGIFINPKGVLGFIPLLRRMSNLKGCNMSFSKQAAYAINGFDEDYILPAIGEDIDLTWRFERCGYRLRSMRNVAVQYHLFHKENWNDQEENIRMMNVKQEKNEFICKNGLNKL
jgi:cellulose synthase/poly-beta-1,6-N-acetylglucosamine synthase-like glycosyltransferase